MEVRNSLRECLWHVILSSRIKLWTGCMHHPTLPKKGESWSDCTSAQAVSTCERNEYASFWPSWLFQIPYDRQSLSYELAVTSNTGRYFCKAAFLCHLLCYTKNPAWFFIQKLLYVRTSALCWSLCTSLSPPTYCFFYSVV